MTASLHPQADDPIVYRQQFDISVVVTEVRPDLVQGLLHTRFQLERMKPVQQEQVRHELIVCERRDQSFSRLSEPRNSLHELRDRCAVKVEQRLHQLARLFTSGRVGQSLEIVDQRLEVLDPAPDFGSLIRDHDGLLSMTGRDVSWDERARAFVRGASPLLCINR